MLKQETKIILTSMFLYVLFISSGHCELTAKLTGKLVDAETGYPLCNVELYASPPEGIVIVSKTDNLGRFEFKVNQYGTYSIGMQIYAADDPKNQHRFDMQVREQWAENRMYGLFVRQQPTIAWVPEIIKGVFIDCEMKDDQFTPKKINDLDLGTIIADRAPVVSCQVLDFDGTPMAGTMIQLAQHQGTAQGALLDDRWMYLMTDEHGRIRMPLINFEHGYRWQCESYFPRTMGFDGTDPIFYHDRLWRMESLRSIKWLKPLPPIIWQPFTRKHYDFKIDWPLEKEAVTLQGVVKEEKTGKPCKDFWIRMDAIGADGGYSTAPLFPNTKEKVDKYSLDVWKNHFSINTLYIREFKTQEGIFRLGHLQPGTVVSISAFSLTEGLWAHQQVVVNNYKDKPLVLSLKPVVTH